jgi:tRNA U54 and U55 pseudouridine synthase Pus10
MMKCLVYLTQKPEEGQDANFHLSKEDIEAKFRERSVQVKLSRKFRVVTRIVHSVGVKKVDDHHPYVLDIDCDGGIPIRKLVSGQDQIVSPNLSSFMHGLDVDPEMPFDILDISFSTADSLGPNPHKVNAPKQPGNWQLQKASPTSGSNLPDSDLILEEY